MPPCAHRQPPWRAWPGPTGPPPGVGAVRSQIGRGSWRGRGENSGVAGSFKKKKIGYGCACINNLEKIISNLKNTCTKFQQRTLICTESREPQLSYPIGVAATDK